MRLESGERVGRDFRARRGNARDERGFSGVGEADESDIGEQLQFEAQAALFAGLAVFVLARSLVPGLGEMRIAAAAVPAASGAILLAGLGEIEKLLAGLLVEDHRADGNFQNCVHAGAAVAVRAFAV